MSETVHSTEELKEEYAEFDYTRPPFNVPHEKWQKNPSYPEIEERSLWLNEEQIFNINSYPIPPEGLSPDHPLQLAFTDLLREHRNLEANMDQIVECSPSKSIIKGQMGGYRRQVQELMQVSPNVKVMDPPPFLDSKEPRNSPKLKTLNRMHFTTKKLFFQSAINYMRLYLACPEVPEELKKESLKELTEWIEVIQAGHIVYNPIKSAVHAKEPKRKSGELTMNHLYQVCVHIINRGRATLGLCKTFEEKKQVFADLKERVIEAECHDYDEDYPELGLDFLSEKLSEHFTPDTAKELSYRSSGYKGLPHPTNLFRRSQHNVVPVLAALSKPKERTLKKGYLTRHRDGLIEKSQIIQFLSVKAADRLNNLKNLKPQKIKSKHRTICESAEIIQLLEDTRSYHPYPRILDLDIQALRSAALTEGRILRDQHSPEMDLEQLSALEAAITFFETN